MLDDVDVGVEGCVESGYPRSALISAKSWKIPTSNMNLSSISFLGGHSQF